MNETVFGARATSQQTDALWVSGTTANVLSQTDSTANPVSGVNIYLVNADTKAVVANLSAGETIDPELIGAANLTLVAEPDESLGAKSIRFNFDDGRFTQTENVAPYALFGDWKGNYQASEPLFIEGGNYALRVEVFDAHGAKGSLIESIELTLSVGAQDTQEDKTTAPSEGAPVEVPEEAREETPTTGDTDTTIGTGDPSTGDADAPVPAEPVTQAPAPTEPDGDGATGGGTTAGGSGHNGSEAPEHGIVTPLTSGLDVIAGRVTTLEHQGSEIESIRVTDLPNFGNLTVNADNTLALVLSHSQQTGSISFGYEVTYADGSSEIVQQNVDVVRGTQELGWGPGDHYMLEEAADGSIVVEHGDIHREVYISESEDALSAADIATMVGTSESNITGSWLANNPQFGSGPSMALQPDIGMQLWKELTEYKDTSHWLLFETGYEYSADDLKSIVFPESSGESELHPLYIGSYGEGARPVLNAEFKIFDSQGPYENIVFQGVNLADGARIYTGHNILFDDVRFEEMLNVQGVESLTVHDSVFFDITKDAPSNGSTWDGMPDRMQGMYVHETDGLLLDGLFLDQIGWEEDYRFDKSADGGQAPSIYSHNIYIQYTSTDVTMRDSISMRAASFGAQIRPGGLIEDNVFIDNNAALNTLGGDSKLGDQQPIGNYSLLNGNLITSGAHKETADFRGALTMGVVNQGRDTALVDNVITHLADPNNPQEQAAKTEDQNPLNHKQDPYYDDTIIYKWIGGLQTEASQSAGTNIDGLDPDLLDETTIQNFAADLLGDPNATIADLADYLRGISEGTIDGDLTADDILAYFQAGFGIHEGERTDPTTVRFTPDDRADGIRWDNKLNWNTDDRPMDGDNVDLASNWVTYAGTHKIVDLFLGDNGRLEVDRGRLDVEGELSGGANAQIDIDEAGQFWVEDYHDTDKLDLDVDGGRFANTGFFDGLLDMHVTGGQALLGVDDAVMELGQGSVLTVRGDDAKVGFDGETGGVSVLRMETGSQLRMIADGGGFSTIGEFRSGAMEDDTPDVLSAFDMGEGTLLIDIGAIAGGAARQEVLVDTDQIVGMFDDVEFIGLGSRQDATLTVDYENDRVTVTLGAAGEGSGKIEVATVGNMLDAAEDAEIWDALTEGQGTYEEADPTPKVNGEDLDEDDILAA